jgi:hypothetical protein
MKEVAVFTTKAIDSIEKSIAKYELQKHCPEVAKVLFVKDINSVDKFEKWLEQFGALINLPEYKDIVSTEEKDLINQLLYMNKNSKIQAIT